MSLSINHNRMAVNTVRHLGENFSNLSQSVRRLSSGLRVGIAADDAAGLAVRELMRSDIAALNQGVRNANDAISMIQTADGALGVIDELLIRMKELAERAATGTYSSVQRKLINNEYLDMAAEIDRIARSADFNGIHLLDGSLAGEHDGSGLNSTGAMKIHFGSGNDSDEDYYYMEIGDCTLAGLGLASGVPVLPHRGSPGSQPGGTITFADGTKVEINNCPGMEEMIGRYTTEHSLGIDVQDSVQYTEWTFDGGMWSGIGTLYTIPAGTKNFLFNIWPVSSDSGGNTNGLIDQDIQLFTKDGVHLAGTSPGTDFSYTIKTEIPYVDSSGKLLQAPPTDLATYGPIMGFTEADYDGTNLNTGPADYNNGNTGVTDNASLNWTNYNGMKIGYSGDSDTANDGSPTAEPHYEVLAIDGEVTEDLYLWVTGNVLMSVYKMYWDGMEKKEIPDDFPIHVIANMGTSGAVLDIATQESAQKALDQIDAAIVKKDNVRAYLGAMQNRLEGTVSNISIQAENLQGSESRISDIDVAKEMTSFIRSQILTESAMSMLSQANSSPDMLMRLLNG